MLNLKKKLESNELTVGSWITLAHPAISEIMSRAGFDWLAIDLEHSVISLREAEDLIRTIELSGSVPLVRLTSNNPDQIKRIMDSGAHGIIVPMVNTVKAAESAVKNSKYPHIGRRSFGLARAQKYGDGLKDYIEWQKKNSLVIVQIEHIDALKELREILSVDGVDGYMIGPYDLSGSMGIPGQFDHPDFLDVIETISSTANELKIPGGIHVVEPNIELLNDAIKKGHNFIAYSVDIRMIDSVCRKAINNLKDKK